MDGSLFNLILHPATSLQSVGTITGYLVLSGIIFAECGLLVGFFLPGDSLLFTAGILAADGLFNFWSVTSLLLLAAIVGVSVGYAFGHRWGRRLFQRPDSRFFKQENLRRAEGFYERYGAETIILARFIPIIRTFAPVVAGIGQMSYPKFLLYNIVGGIIWVPGLVGVGYWLGHQVKNIDRYLLPIIAVIILLSILPGLVEMLKTPERRSSVRTALGRIFRRKNM